MDAPWSQRGENTHNVWSDTGTNQVDGVAIMVDNFAIPAATVRGLFDYDYRFDRLICGLACLVRSPNTFRRSPCDLAKRRSIFLAAMADEDSSRSRSMAKTLKTESPDAVSLLYDELSKEAKIEIVTEGGWIADSAKAGHAVLNVSTGFRGRRSQS